jgi:hypothetical protein
MPLHTDKIRKKKPANTPGSPYHTASLQQAACRDGIEINDQEGKVYKPIEDI